MSQNLTISETGLKLIKAFEGYRPVDRELISGQRIVGYGHRLYSEDAVAMNKSEAESTLLADLEPFEDMINSEVHAPISQSQFDALCSFAFNIGPKAFLQSDTLRALNNGRPLDAANGLDIWRKSEIAGKTYVVDALMRRRTAEKSLFLRTKRELPAGREDIPPVRDTAIATLSTEDAFPVFTESDANGIVATAPYDAYVSPMRRQEDHLVGALQLSERDIIDGETRLEDADLTDVQEVDFQERDSQENEATVELDDKPLVPLDEDIDLDLNSDIDLKEEETEIEVLEEPEVRQSPIAAAATDIVARLDALIEDADARFEDTETDWPESLLAAEEDQIDVVNEPVEAAEPEDYHEEVQDDYQNVIDLNTGNSRPTDLLDDTVAAVETTSLIKETGAPAEADTVLVIDELAQDDAFKIRSDSAAKYIETTEPVRLDESVPETGGFGLWVLVLLGFTLVGLAGGAMMKGSKAIFGEWGPIISFTGFVIGIGLILAGIYAALRMNRRS